MAAAKNKYLKTSKKFKSRIELTGSFRKLPTGTNIGNTSFNQVIEVLLKIRTPPSGPGLIKFPSMRIPEVTHRENKTQVSIVFPKQVVLSSSLDTILQNYQER